MDDRDAGAGQQEAVVCMGTLVSSILQFWFSEFAAIPLGIRGLFKVGLAQVERGYLKSAY